MLGEENIGAYDLKCRTPVIRLDEYFHGQAADPDLVKIDIDGAELLALQGMRRILQETKPDLLLEVHPAYLPSFGSSAADDCNLLLEFDYRFFSIQISATQRPPASLRYSTSITLPHQQVT
jgi:hypothetical protein